MGEFHSKVAGVTAKNDDGMDRQGIIVKYCKSGMPLILKREPYNKYDKNAIAVLVKSKMFFFINVAFQIGYINSDLSGELARHIDKGGKVTATITEVTGGGRKKSYGVNILVDKQS